MYVFYHFVAPTCDDAIDCSGNGACQADGTCVCQPDYFEPDCSSKV